MQKQSFSRAIFIAVFLLFTSGIAQAGIFPFFAPRLQSTSGIPVTTGSNSSVEALPRPTASDNDIYAKDKITFGVDHNSMTYGTAAVYEVTLKVELWAAGNTTTTPSSTISQLILTINYQPFNNSVTPYLDKSVYTFKDAYKFKITVLGFKVNTVATTNLPLNLFIDGDILLERYTTFATATTAISPITETLKDLDCNSVNDEIQISWPAQTGVEEYQLEWTFVNDYGTSTGGTYALVSTLAYDFRNNSTRITTTNTSYNIGLTFEHGYLIFRVRGIGRSITDPTKSIVGVWNVAADAAALSTLVPSVPSSYYYNTTEHESNKNWQYSATYAEEGKKKEVISYFDGSLRNRQSVTKVNSDNNTIVGETIYDHQGRPAINVLPVPVKPPACSAGVAAIKYYPSFNPVTGSSVEYSRADFDADKTGDTCSSIVNAGMNVSSGASNYYSSSNPNKTAQQGFVPDAELYPFSQVEYTPDNTGRIRRQGGVGKEFQLDKQHETKYFYGSPYQVQLDRLFGSEAGDATHYKKNMVMDANGQASISYLDQEGRTIATSLAGDAPTDAATHSITILEALPSMTGATVALNVDLFNKNADGVSSLNVKNLEGNGIEFSSQLLVSYQSSYQFTYSMQVDKLADPCLLSTVCFNCVYDLEIKVTDDCAKTVATTSGTNPIKKPIGRFTTDGSGNLVFNTVCASPPLPYTDAETFTVTLPPGNYNVIKKLTVNKAAEDFYVKAYFDTVNTPKLGTYKNLSSTCFKTYQSFLDSSLAHMDTADCNISCQACAASMMAGYSTIQDARDAWVAAGKGTELDFDYLLEECNAPCRETSVCATNYEIMLMDVSPDGQYAQFQPKTDADGNIIPPDLNLSVLNTGNVLPQNLLTGTAHWRKPTINISGTQYGVYIDEHGVRTRISVSLTGAGCTSGDGLGGTYCVPAVYDCSKVYYDAGTDTYYTYPENLANLSDFVANWTDNWAKSLVFYHPEYPYYRSCIDYNIVKNTGFTSDTFDSLLIRTKTYAEAQTLGLVKPAIAGTTSTGSMILFNQSIGAIKDPFLFSAPFTGSTPDYGSALLTSMGNFQGTGRSMQTLAATAARCGTRYGIVFTTNDPCYDFGSTSSTPATIRDNEWNIFKNMYISEKQRLQKLRDDNFAIATYGYNGCIGNTGYNPFISGIYSSLYAFYLAEIFTFYQPCGFVHVNYYYNKKRRFYSNSSLTAPTPNEADYQAYLETGQCPLALDLQNTLSGLATSVKLTNTAGEPLTDHPEFTQDLYIAVNSGVAPTSYTPFTWKAITTPATTDVYTTQIKNGATVLQTIVLNKTGAGITSWDDVVGISQLKWTSTSGISPLTYSFSAVAAIANPPLSTQVYSYKAITGTITAGTGLITVPITGCAGTFTQTCTPNDLARDLNNVWSAISINGGLSTTSIPLNVTTPYNYSAFITLAIKNALGTTSNNLIWNKSAAGQYDIYESSASNIKLRINFTTPATFPTAPAGLYVFANIKSTTTAGAFVVDGLNNTGTVLSPQIQGTINLVNTTTSTSVPVTLGTCALPAPVLCKGDPYQLRQDLETLLKNVMLGHTSTFTTYTPDLTLNPAYTSLLQSYVGTSVLQSTTKYDYITLNTANDYKEQILFNLLCKCRITLWHKGLGSNIMKFQNLPLVTGLDTLKPYGPVASDGNQYKFYFYAHYPTGTDTIYGESCFPLKFCNSKMPADTVLSPQKPYVNPCILYQINIAHINAQNEYEQYIDSLTTDLADRYEKNCLSALETFNAAYNDKEYHFTLYYYDQAGNLVKTIPPEGVELVTSSTDFASIITDRTRNQHNFCTNHRMATTYEYNSLNQLIRQNMPDHDAMPIWEYTYPNGLDTRLKVTATQFVNSMKGYLTGYVDFSTFKRGYLYTTDDGGATWKKMNDLVATDFKKIQMATATVGYAVANNGIVMKTADGGNTWDMITLPNVIFAKDLYFSSDLIGFVIGDLSGVSAVYKTINGGTAWTIPTSPGTGTLTAITSDGTNLYVSRDAGPSFIYKSPISSIAWTAQSVRSTDLKKIQMIGATINGFAIGVDGTLLSTTNSGANWLTVATGTSANFKDVYFKNTLEGVAIIESTPGGGGLIWKTLDGGVTWTLLSADDGTNYYNSFYFYQSDKGYAVGNNKIKRVVMSGLYGLVDINPPTASPLGTPLNLSAAYFTDANSGWVVSSTSQTAYFTTNANSTAAVWIAAPTLITGTPGLTDIYFNGTNNNGLAISTAGNVYKILSTGGTTYSFTAISSGGGYVNMDEASATTSVYAFNATSGTLGTVVKANIASTSSLAMLSNLGATLNPGRVNAITIPAPSTILVAGGSGDIFKGAVSGSNVTWTDNSKNVRPLGLYDIEAAGANNIYAVGKQGTLLQTTDGGTTWQTLPTASTSQFNAIKFNRSGTTSITFPYSGYIAGSNGFLNKVDVATGSVLTATAVPLTVTANLNDIALNTAGKAYIAGDAGTVISIPSITTPVADIASPQPAVNFNGLSFVPATNRVIVAGNNASLYTYNGTSGITGTSGAKINGVFTPNLTGVSFSNTMDGYVIGELKTVRYTSDGGLTWNYVTQMAANAMNAISAWAPGKAVIVGNAGYVRHVTGTTIASTAPAGATGYTAHLYDVSIAQNGVGYIVGASVAYKMPDINAVTPTWSALISGTPAVTFRKLHIFGNTLASNSFMAVGDAGKIYCFNTSSAWVAYTPPTGYTTTNFSDVYYHDDRTGYVVGAAGAVLRCTTASNANIWAPSTTMVFTPQVLSGTNGVTTPSQVDVKTIDFPSRYNGFLGGAFNTAIPAPNYARLLTDETNSFSTRFWYDRLGRMVISQNTKQYNRKNLSSQTGRSDYSYTLYDGLGRISEVGEKTENTTGTLFSGIFGQDINGVFNPNVINDANLLSWVNTGSNRREVTRTYYDNAIVGLPASIVQDNLRKRVSSVTYEDVGDSGAGSDTTYQHATHYSYDIHGNVKTLWQQNKQIAIYSQKLKKIDYEYDLISGKVNLVRYQDGQPDAFYHYYEYDADNRITDVYTSSYPQTAGQLINSNTVRSNSLWAKDGHYTYYAHGPVARVLVGENQSQGMDYAYTLQGWIKGVNSNLLTSVNDMGNDGLIVTNSRTGKDALGYTLNYYQGDYKAIDGSRWTTLATRFEGNIGGSLLAAARYDLDNGNISAMATTITQPILYSTAGSGTSTITAPTILPQGTAYKYDQLNRLRTMEAYANLAGTNQWQTTGSYNGRYNNTFTYDANGNIKTQVRKTETGGTSIIDDLSYKYVYDPITSKLAKNRLDYVDDAVTSGTFTDDIDDESTGNYTYDEIGNLAGDVQEQILRIDWTVYGKIKKIVRTSASTKTSLEFKYDASGNRVAKIEKPAGSFADAGVGTDNPTLWTTTYYMRDAQGNIMSTYKYVNPGTSSFKLAERNLFGSSRLGTENTQIEMIGASLTPANPYVKTLGNKYFEATNHLGNVLAVFTDKKIPRDDGDYDSNNDGIDDLGSTGTYTADGVVDYFQPEIITTGDYYPFGAPMNERNFRLVLKKGPNYGTNPNDVFYAYVLPSEPAANIASENRYRYGFNGQEKDDELKAGIGNTYTAEFWEYEPRLGRRWNLDPKLKTGFSGYGTFGNNPIAYCDIKGDSWDVKKSEDKQGNVTYDITVDAAILNSSSEKRIDPAKFQAAVIKQIKEVYSGSDLNMKTGKTTTWNIKANIRTINSPSELGKSEHLIEIVNPTNDVLYENGSWGDARAVDGGMRVYVSSLMAVETSMGINQRTIAHELGHTAGWLHPNNVSSTDEQWLNPNNQYNQYNVMWQTGYVRDRFHINPSDANNINTTQLGIMYRNYKNGDLNKKSNFESKLEFRPTFPYVFSVPTQTLAYPK